MLSYIRYNYLHLGHPVVIYKTKWRNKKQSQLLINTLNNLYT
jgi:hypothetical protein